MVLDGVWKIDSTSLLLKRWSPMFDASKEKVDKLPLWVHLSSLPSKFWNSKSFREMGNLLGLYLVVDMSFESTSQRYVAHILVLINIREGLVEDLNLFQGLTFVQKLDYEGVSFRCRQCHQVGHVVRECRLVSQGQSSFSQRTKSKKRVACQEGLEPPLVTDLQAVSEEPRTNIVELGLLIVEDDSLVLPGLLDMVCFQGNPSRDHPQHSLSCQGMSLKLLPSLSVMFNSFSLLGQSWSKPLKGLAFFDGGVRFLELSFAWTLQLSLLHISPSPHFLPASISSELRKNLTWRGFYTSFVIAPSRL
jgi:hypothetical protein